MSRRAIAVLLSVALAGAGAPAPAVSAAAALRGGAPAARPTPAALHATAASLARFSLRLRTPNGRGVGSGVWPDLGDLALASPDGEGGRAVLLSVARHMLENDPGVVAALEDVEPPAEQLAALLSALKDAKERSRVELLEYAAVIRSMLRSRALTRDDRWELRTLAAELSAMHAVFGDAAFRDAQAEVEARARETILASARRALAGVRGLWDRSQRPPQPAAGDAYRLGVAYLRLEKRERAVEKLERAVDLGHLRARYALEEIPGTHGAERFPEMLHPLKPDTMPLNLASEPQPLRYWAPLATVILAAFNLQFIGSRFLGLDTGLFSLSNRVVLGATGLIWMYYEWRQRSGGAWSWKMGWRNGLVTLVSGVRWMLPFMIAGVFFQEHDPVPPIARHFGGYWQSMALMPLLVAFEEAFVRLALFLGLLYSLQKRLASGRAAFFIAAGVSAAFFGLLHQQYNPLFMIGVGIVGYFLALGYYQSRWLWVPIAAHLTMNLAAVWTRLVARLFGIDGFW